MAKRKNKVDLSLEQARELFRYENGKLFLKTNIKYSKHSIGDQVGSNNYFIPLVNTNGQVYQIHRFV
jgi:hypothetical protein